MALKRLTMNERWKLQRWLESKIEEFGKSNVSRDEAAVQASADLGFDIHGHHIKHIHDTIPDLRWAERRVRPRSLDAGPDCAALLDLVQQQEQRIVALEAKLRQLAPFVAIGEQAGKGLLELTVRNVANGRDFELLPVRPN